MDRNIGRLRDWDRAHGRELDRAGWVASAADDLQRIRDDIAARHPASRRPDPLPAVNAPSSAELPLAILGQGAYAREVRAGAPARPGGRLNVAG